MALALKLEEMSLAEKLQTIEVIWESITSQNANDLASPAWHKTSLEQTQANYLAGKETAVDWQEAKEELRKLYVMKIKKQAKF